MTASLVDLVRPATALLIDFDGPICSLFAGYPAEKIADELRALVEARGFAVTARGPVQLLQEVANLGDRALTHEVAEAAWRAELAAAASATPTPGADLLLDAAHDTGRRVAFVSNNSQVAVLSYLFGHDLGNGDLAIGRHEKMDPRRLKPDPYLVRSALKHLPAAPDEAVFIGDSPSDIEAGRVAGVATIGYANKPGKRKKLAEADAVIDSLDELVSALQAAPVTT